MITEISKVNRKLFERYLRLINESTLGNLDTIRKMCVYALSNDMLEDKQSRWLGFVQGVLFSNDLISIDTERDFSRKLYHNAYELMGIDIPDSVNLK